jgi:hypothetical protein
MLAGAHGFNYLIGIFLGYFGAQLADFSHPMAVSASRSDEDTVTVVVLYLCQSGQVGGIRIDGKFVNDY